MPKIPTRPSTERPAQLILHLGWEGGPTNDAHVEKAGQAWLLWPKPDPARDQMAGKVVLPPSWQQKDGLPGRAGAAGGKPSVLMKLISNDCDLTAFTCTHRYMQIPSPSSWTDSLGLSMAKPCSNHRVNVYHQTCLNLDPLFAAVEQQLPHKIQCDAKPS